MSFLLDFHIHSHYSIATSKECDPEHLFLWSCLKGISVVGTGDFTHPGWFQEIKEKLIPAEEGLLRLRPELEREMLDKIPKSCHGQVRFILSSEISSIYKRGGKTRKVHNCILVPSFEKAEAISSRLDRIGNIRSDGRPILGLDSHDLLEIMLEEAPEGIFIPAHIWTPHFSLFGAYSGFDAIEECFDDLTPHIWALETGLSSDPAMNWRLSALDRYTLVSNSDAHSPKNLAREANHLCCDLSFPSIVAAIKEKKKGQFLGTIEFFPQEGKYHYNGHRGCGIRMTPEETTELGGICPKCGKSLTLGVLHRVAELADRPPGYKPENASPFQGIVPLPEIVADYLGCGVNSKRVQQAYLNLLHKIGPEWQILTMCPLEEITIHAGHSLAEGIARMRAGKIQIKPGFDGEYGTISLFSPEERGEKMTQMGLFAAQAPSPSEKSTSPAPQKRRAAKHPKREESSAGVTCIDESDQKLDKGEDPVKEWAKGLNHSQAGAVESFPGPVLVIAGPGTGKTQTLACRVSYLIKEMDIQPHEILAITFTNKAAKEMAHRMGHLYGQGCPPSTPFIGTFHQFCLDILRQYNPKPGFMLFHQHDSIALLTMILQEKKGEGLPKPREALHEISLLKAMNGVHRPEDTDPVLRWVYEEYQEGLKRFNAMDYDDLLLNTVALLKGEGALRGTLTRRYRHILVDEFQDINPIQYELIHILAGERGEGLFLIGDPNQAIYGFRGSDVGLFSRIREEFPNAKTCSLEWNYRSYEPILSGAIGVISHNPQPVLLNLKAQRGPGPLIRIIQPPSEKGEGIAIVKEIGTLIGGIDMLHAHGEKGGGECKGQNGYSFSDFAILFRTYAQADILEECLLREGIPYRVVGHKGIMENPLIRQILSFLRWTHRPEDRYSLLQALQLPVFSLSKEEINRYAGACYCDPEAGQGSKAITEALSHYRMIAIDKGPTCFIEEVRIGLEPYGLPQPAIKDIERLASLSSEFADISEFLEGVMLLREGDVSWKGLKGMEMVSLMTLHAAKGLEFPVVFICGCTDGVLPYRLFNRNADINEERRLFYVGMTRARDMLYMTWSKSPTLKGWQGDVQVSPFIGEIPDRYHEKVQGRHTLPPRPRHRQLSLW